MYQTICFPMSFPTPLVLFPLIFPTPSPSVLAIQLGLSPIFPFLHNTGVLMFLHSHTPTPREVFYFIGFYGYFGLYTQI